VSFAPVVVRDVSADDEQEFLLLLEPLLPMAYRLALGLLRSESDAEDAVQSAVLNAWRHFGQFRRGSELKPWLLTIVANECRRQRRNRWWSVIKRPGFAFATYFEANGNWYWLLLSTDPSAQTYKGPGTYTIPAYLYTGSGQPLYKGTAQLTVSNAQFPDFGGSVQATLNGLEIVGTQSQVTVSGDWTCHFTPNLGPA